MKKNVLLIICVVLLTVSFAGCGGGGIVRPKDTHPEVVNTTGRGPLLKEAYWDTFSIEMMAPNYYLMDINWAENKFFKDMYEETKVKFDFKIFDWGTYGTKKPLAIAADETRPDVFFRAMFDAQEEIKYGQQGFLRPLNDYIDDYMPNFKALMDADPQIERLIRVPDGNIYCLPTVGDKDKYKVLAMPFINQKWLKNLNLSMPATPEELYNVLKAFKERDANGNGNPNDEIPMYISGGYEEAFLFSFFGIDNLNYIQRDKNGNLEFGPGTERYKDALRWLAKLVDEGIMNDDYLNKSVQEKWTQGQKLNGDCLGFFMDYAAYPVVGYDAALNYVALDTVKNEYFGEAMWASMYPVERGMFAITNVCEYPELVCAWLDKLYSEPYNINALIGKEGEAWRWIGEGEDRKWEYIISESERAQYMSKSTIQFGGGLPYKTPGHAFFKKSADEVTVATYSAEELIANIGFEGFPRITMKNTAVVKQIAVMYADISKYIDALKSNIITGKLTVDAAYADYNTKSRQLNFSGFLKCYQEAYDIYLAN